MRDKLLCFGSYLLIHYIFRASAGAAAVLSVSRRRQNTSEGDARSHHGVQTKRPCVCSAALTVFSSDLMTENVLQLNEIFLCLLSSLSLCLPLCLSLVSSLFFFIAFCFAADTQFWPIKLRETDLFIWICQLFFLLLIIMLPYNFYV